MWFCSEGFVLIEIGPIKAFADDGFGRRMPALSELRSLFNLNVGELRTATLPLSATRIAPAWVGQSLSGQVRDLNDQAVFKMQYFQRCILWG